MSSFIDLKLPVRIVDFGRLLVPFPLGCWSRVVLMLAALRPVSLRSCCARLRLLSVRGAAAARCRSLPATHTHHRQLSTALPMWAPAETAGQPATIAPAGDSKSTPSSSSSSSSFGRLVRGSRSRFLSPDYPIPFEPLTRPLSFNDTDSWPEEPMQVFSQWSGHDTQGEVSDAGTMTGVC